ncbi:hypothetical protein BC830DRAFT_1116952 [Chytriomyces sp. MP71]|nr:hypothetical protein BC830DRAFT_1116952 [Chytriomyces sp. MP71]
MLLVLVILISKKIILPMNAKTTTPFVPERKSSLSCLQRNIKSPKLSPASLDFRIPSEQLPPKPQWTQSLPLATEPTPALQATSLNFNLDRRGSNSSTASSNLVKTFADLMEEIAFLLDQQEYELERGESQDHASAKTKKMPGSYSIILNQYAIGDYEPVEEFRLDMTRTRSNKRVAHSCDIESLNLTQLSEDDYLDEAQVRRVVTLLRDKGMSVVEEKDGPMDSDTCVHKERFCMLRHLLKGKVLWHHEK